jgi:hypothetical protein
MTKQQTLQNNLADELLLWSEEPEATAYFGWGVAGGILFCFMWLSMVVFGFSDSPEEFNPIGLIFITLGLFFLGSTIWEPLTALFTIYGITNKRLLIVRSFPWGNEVESYFGPDIDFIKKTEKANGRGSIVFTTVQYTGGKGRISQKDIGFIGIDNVNRVEALIVKTFRSATAQ